MPDVQSNSIHAASPLKAGAHCHKYKFAQVSGVSAQEDVLEGFKRNNFFFTVDDRQDGISFRGAGGTYFERRQYTVYNIGRADYGNMNQRQEILTEAKIIFRSILTQLIKDKTTIPVLKVENTRFCFWQQRPLFHVHGRKPG